jgi:hypothetical protein
MHMVKNQSHVRCRTALERLADRRGGGPGVPAKIGVLWRAEPIAAAALASAPA